MMHQPTEAEEAMVQMAAAALVTPDLATMRRAVVAMNDAFDCHAG